jgi:hypothetical protein
MEGKKEGKKEGRKEEGKEGRKAHLLGWHYFTGRIVLS